MAYAKTCETKRNTHFETHNATTSLKISKFALSQVVSGGKYYVPQGKYKTGIGIRQPHKHSIPHRQK